MDAERKILENYYQRNATGFEFADSEQFGDVATYFGVSRVYIDRLEKQLSQLKQEKKELIEWLENKKKYCIQEKDTVAPATPNYTFTISNKEYIDDLGKEQLLGCYLTCEILLERLGEKRC